MAAKVLRPHQEELLEAIRNSIRGGNRRIMAQAVTGFGKCTGIGTPILLYDGRTVPVEQIVEGDLLMGPDSRPRRVLSTCRGHGPLFRIVPKKGDPWVCNDVHILTLVNTVSGEIVDIPLNRYLETKPVFKHRHKQFAPENGVDFKVSTDPSIPPYFLGLWIGDGTKDLRDVSVTKPDDQVRDECERVAELYGCSVRVSGLHREGGCPTWVIHKPRGEVNPLRDELRRLMGDRTIPLSVRSASRAYRMAVLAGALDSDGHLVKSTVFEVAQKSADYAEGIAFLARSLGFKVTTRIKVVNGTPYHRLHIFGETSTIPTRIPRKQASQRRQIKVATRTGFSVESIGDGEYAGFELDGDGRFLLGDFTVTHNTICAITMIRNVYEKGRRAIFVVPAVQLVNQTVERLAEEGIYDVGVIQANHEMTNAAHPIQVASVQTLLNRTLEEKCEQATRRRSVARRDDMGNILEEEYFDEDTKTTKKRILKHTINKDVLLEPIPPADLVIVDEAHVLYGLHDEWMNHPRWSKVPFIGLSATPWTRGLGKVYQDLVCGMPMADLIEKGYLSPFRVFAPSKPDLTNVRIVGDDYHEGDLSEAMTQGGLTADIVDSWLKHARSQPTLCFCVDRKHAALVQEQFRRAGVNAGYVDAFTSPEDRKELQRAFAAREIEVVCNVGVLTTGVDWDVRCIILARPTRSESLFVQIIGRGLRTAEGKEDCIILDHSDNHQRMGFVTDIHHPKLSTGEKVDGAARPGEKERLPKECPRCQFVRAPNLKTCPNCGFETVAKSKIECQDGELVEITGKKKRRASHALMQEWYSMFLHYCNKRGDKPGRVSYLFKDKFDEWPKGMREIPLEPNEEFLRYIKYLNIKSAFGKRRAHA